MTDGTRLVKIDESQHWRDRLGGIDRALYVGTPECGFYRRKLVKDGPWCAAAIWLQYYVLHESGELMSDEALCCHVAGEPADPYEQWLRVADQPVARREHDYLEAMRRWAQQPGVRHPMATPRRKVDLLAMPIFFGGSR